MDLRKMNKEMLDNALVFVDEISNQLEESTKHRVDWVNVKQAPYNAKGDKVTDDTLAFTNALNDLSSGGGGTLYVPYGNYRLTSITIPRNVTFKMDKGVFEYALENFGLNANDPALIDNSLIKHDDSPVMITCHGHMENVRINGNRKLGLAVEMRGTFEGLYITRAKQALLIARSGYQYKDLWLGGNLGDALTWGQGVSDSRLELFNIWSNVGHGCVFAGNNGTINLSNGKIEWNFKNSVEIIGFTNEITFDNMILDAPSWYNIHLNPGAHALNWKFIGTNIIGSRRDSTNVYGELLPLVPYANATFSQIFIESNSFDVTFASTYFRKVNALHYAMVTERVTHIFGGNAITLGYPIVLDSCDCADFAYANWKTGIESYIHSIIGTRFSDSPPFLGGVVTGEILLPIVTTANLNSYPTKKQGLTTFNSDDKTLNVYMWGNNYKMKTNQQGKYVAVPTSVNATGEIGDYSADANYFYICYATNLWRRVAISTW